MRYRLPNGEETEDADEMQREWYKLVQIAESLFPGYRVTGFDPGLVLTKYAVNRYGEKVPADTLRMSVGALEALRESVKKGGFEWVT